MAGKQNGLQDGRSSRFHDMIQVMRYLQTSQRRPLGYIVENVLVVSSSRSRTLESMHQIHIRRPIRGRTYQLHTDWSSLGIGAVPTQMDDDGKEFMIAYTSRFNNNTEAQYNSYEGECLAAIWAIAHFRCYLYGNEFLLVTDHQPLKSLMVSDKLTRKLVQWALMLMEYDFKVVHRAGLVNMDVDGLSRNPVLSQADATGARWHVEEGEDSLP
jgi:hypothetical protein